VSSSTTGTGILALVASIWLASSFWGALDVSFSGSITALAPVGPTEALWIVMVGIVLLFMFATVLIPTAQSLLKATAGDLPLDLAHVHDIVYVISLVAASRSCSAVWP